MNAFELLKNDHDKVQAIFEKLASTTERAIKTREEHFSKLKEELEIHSHLEETILYPVLKEEAQTRDLTVQALEKHRFISLLLNEIGDLPVDNEQWGAKFKILKDIVESHVKDEEGELFKAARAALSKERIEEISVKMESEKLYQQTEEAATARTQSSQARSAELRVERRTEGRGEVRRVISKRADEGRGDERAEVRVGVSQGRRQRPFVYFNLSCLRLPPCRREC
jgi:hypothetical protein